MALHMRLMVNNEQIGYLTAQRRQPGRPRDDDTCSYDWQVNIDGKTSSNHDETPLAHRYGDGAWTLVRRIIEAAGYTSVATGPASEPTPGLGIREQAKASLHPVLHDLNVRIVGIDKGDCHCNLITEVALDALGDAFAAHRRQVLAEAAAEHVVTVAFDKHEGPRTTADKILAAHRWGWPETHPATGPGSTQPDESGSVVAQEAPDAAPAAVDLMAALRASLELADPRDTAHTWLAEQICASAIEAGGQALEPPCGSCRRRADAILNGPGAEVSEEPALMPEGASPYRLTTRLVIRLPAQSIEDGRDG